MTFLMVLAVTVAACLALRTPLHKWPVAFYVLAVAADVAYVIGVEGLLPRAMRSEQELEAGAYCDYDDFVAGVREEYGL